MDSSELVLAFEEITKADVPELAAVMTRAFDDDSRKHLGQERGGPPGYDDGEYIHKWVFGFRETVGYKILAQGRIIGGLILWIFAHGRNHLGTIFVDPAYQDRGVGLRTWEFIQATYPKAQSWTLKTPAFALKNHYFYETKLGFTKVGEEAYDGPGGKLFVYSREMEPVPSPSASGH